MTTREWLGRRLPLWTLVLVGVVLLGVAESLLVLVDSMLVFLAILPLTILGLYTLAYAGGECSSMLPLRRSRSWGASQDPSPNTIGKWHRRSWTICRTRWEAKP